MEQGCKGLRGAKNVEDVISALINHLDENGGIDQLIDGRETALHIAIRCGREDLVERLIQDLEAKVNIPDHNGDYPVHVALRQSDQMKHIKFLQGSPTYDASVKDRDGRAFTDIQKREGPPQDDLAGMPLLDPSQAHMGRRLLPECVGQVPESLQSSVD